MRLELPKEKGRRKESLTYFPPSPRMARRGKKRGGKKKGERRENGGGRYQPPK